MTSLEDADLVSLMAARQNITTATFMLYLQNDSLLLLDLLNATQPYPLASTYPTGGCQTFLLVFFTFFVGTMCILGFIGNVISMAILRRDRGGGRVHAAMFLLQALAIADNCVLGISFIFLCIIFGLLPAVNAMQLRRMLIPYIVAYVEPVAHMAHSATVWMTVLLAVNRYVAICRPFDTHRLASIAKTRLQVAAVFGCAVFLNFPRFFQNRVVYVANASVPVKQTTAIGTRSTFGLVYTTWLYTVVVFILPLILLVILNGRLIVELRRMSRRRSSSIPDEHKSEENITLVMIVIIIVFIVCICPERVNTIVKPFIRQRNCSPWFYFDCASQMLVVTNSSTNFLIYYIFRRRFRQILLRKLCWCQLSRPEECTLNGAAGNHQAITLLSTADVTVTSVPPTVTNAAKTSL